MKLFLIITLLLFSSVFPVFGQDWGGSWVATDGLGRTLPTAEECPLKADGRQRTVGIFYITWHTPDHHNGQPYTYDVSKRIADNPMCTRGNPDFPYATYHWGEPDRKSVV